MKYTSLLRLTFAGVLLAGLSLSVPTLFADEGGGCSSCSGHAKASPTPAGTNAPTKS